MEPKEETIQKESRKLKILFIKPKTDLHVIIPPINFLYLAGHLKNHNVRIIDGNCYKLSDKEIIEELTDFNPDIIGFGGLSSEIDFSLGLAKKIRQITRAIIVFGGVHTTNLYEEILNQEFVDFIFRAESEIPFSEFVEKISNQKDYHRVPNLGFKRNGKIILNPIKIYDFNLIEMPNWSLINLKDYPKMFINRKSPCAPIFTSRGCPFSCTFCSSSTMNGGKYRERDLDKVINELKYLKKEFGIKEFHIWDENLTLNRTRIIDFCNRLIKEKLDLVWNCPNGIRVDTLDEELLKKMKQAGCWALSLAIEFGSQRMLDFVNKKTDLEKIKKIIPLIEKNGIESTLFFIIGHPEETEEELNKTLKLSLDLPASRAYFSIYKVLPGSLDYLRYGKEKERIIFSEGNEKIKRFQRKAILLFYLRPRQVIRMVLGNLNPSQIGELTKMIKNFILK